MLTEQENVTLTRTGPATPMGKTFRQYWMPALLSRELPAPDCPPKRMRLLGEDFIAFRDTEGTVGIVEPRCPHRGANLFFGRNADCGLRCAYHGWKFNTQGECTDIPIVDAQVAEQLAFAHLRCANGAT
jgi:phthalate 4,5-dioxygenase oxygenase subunit